MTEQSTTSRTQPPPLPLGIEGAKRLIREKLNLVVDETDPVMVSVLLHQVFLSDQARQQEIFLEELKQLLEQSGQEMTGAVKQSLHSLTGGTFRDILETTLAASAHHVRQSTENHLKLTAVIKRYTVVNLIFTFLVWAAVAALAFVFK